MFQPAAAQDADPPAAAWTAALLGLAVDDDEGGVNEPHLTTAKNDLCLNCIGKRVVETGDLTPLKKPGNVTKVNSTIQAEVAHIGSVTADFVKG